MKEFQPPVGDHSDDRDPEDRDFAGDALERLVEAFVEQSVPTGPDAATRRRMLAAMHAASSPGGLRLLAPSDAEERTHPGPRVRHWLAIAARQTAGIAAAILVVVGAALYTMSRQNNAPTPNSPSEENLAIDSPAAPASSDPAVAMPEELVRALDSYLRTHGAQASDPASLQRFVATVFRDNPRLANSPSWRFAQARLSDALEKPEVIGVGVGLLGTLPWKTYARF